MLSDELVRTDSQVESIVKKAERLFYESRTADGGKEVEDPLMVGTG